VFEPRDARTDGRKIRAEDERKSSSQLFTFLDALCRHQELRKIRRRELLIEGQVEARRARPDEVDVVIDLRALRQDGLEALRLIESRGEGGTLRQAQID